MLLAASPYSCHRAVLEQLRRFRRARARERGQGAECTYVKVSCVPRKLSSQTTPSASKSRARPARAKASFACAGRPDGGSSVVELDPLPLENGRRLPKHIRGVRVLLARAQVRLCELHDRVELERKVLEPAQLVCPAGHHLGEHLLLLRHVVLVLLRVAPHLPDPLLLPLNFPVRRHPVLHETRDGTRLDLELLDRVGARHFGLYLTFSPTDLAEAAEG
mmetsp:Transcript_7930/g.26130  ORF Transcript_7930/g.26130 Transcript_7930/m.26130 type:complete len:219 (+) Transcript_7930:88-744(+)